MGILSVAVPLPPVLSDTTPQPTTVNAKNGDEVRFGLRDNDEVRVVLPDYNDTLLEKYVDNLVTYFSTFQYKSIKLEASEWHNLAVTNSDIKLTKMNVISSSKMSDIYSQRHGLTLDDNVILKGFPCNKLPINNMDSSFCMFWFVKFNFSPDDYISSFGKSHNLIEIYSSNVVGSIALSIKLRLKANNANTEFNEEFIINYGGVEYTHKLTTIERLNINVDFTRGVHLITLQKYREASNWYVKMQLDDNKILFPPIKLNLDQIDYVYSPNVTRTSQFPNSMVFIGAPFMINKRQEGSTQRPTYFESLKMNLISFGVMNKSPNDNGAVIKDIYNTSITQHNVYLTSYFVSSENSMKKRENDIIEYATKRRCKMSETVCNACETVDWSDFGSFMKSGPCVSAMKDRCNIMKLNGPTSVNAHENEFCSIMRAFGPPPPPPPPPTDEERTDLGKEERTKLEDELRDIKLMAQQANIQAQTNSRALSSTEYSQESEKTDFDVVSKNMLYRPITNLTVDDVNRISKAKKPSFTDIDMNTNENVVKKIPSLFKTDAVIADPKESETTEDTKSIFNDKYMDKQSLYDKIMKDFNNELSEKGLSSSFENGNVNTSSGVGVFGNIMKWFF
jgi:hypothetical protein